MRRVLFGCIRMVMVSLWFLGASWFFAWQFERTTPCGLLGFCSHGPWGLWNGGCMGLLSLWLSGYKCLAWTPWSLKHIRGSLQKSIITSLNPTLSIPSDNPNHTLPIITCQLGSWQWSTYTIHSGCSSKLSRKWLSFAVASKFGPNLICLCWVFPNIPSVAFATVHCKWILDLPSTSK